MEEKLLRDKENRLRDSVTSSKPRESHFRLSNSKPYFTESIYQNQKKQINDINDKFKTINDNNKVSEKDTLKENKKYIIFNDANDETHKINWEYAMFETEIIFQDECPIIKKDWSESDLDQNPAGIQLRNLIFRSNDDINLVNLASDIYFDVELKGESTFWLILRNSVSLNKYSAILKFSKENNSQKVFVSYGTFVHDHEDHPIFKVFLKQQLINYSRDKNKPFIERDVCQIRANIHDNGDDKIKSNIYLNHSSTDNSILGSFFLPIYDKSKIMIAGSGHSVLVKVFFVKQVNRDTNAEPRDTAYIEKKNCDCCQIF